MPDSEPDLKPAATRGRLGQESGAVHPLARTGSYPMAADRAPLRRLLTGAGGLIVLGGIALLAYYGGVFGHRQEAASTAAQATAPSSAQAGIVSVTEPQMRQIKVGV